MSVKVANVASDVGGPRALRQRAGRRAALLSASAAALALAIPLVIIWKWPSARWEFVPLHSLAEGTGGVLALVISGVLVAECQRDARLGHYIWIAAALGGMGTLDIFHAAVRPGNLFVWLHSLANLAGGGFFALVWLKPRWSAPRAWVLPVCVVAAGVLVGSASCLAPGVLPAMIVSHEFSTTAKLLNVGGGAAFFVAAAYFIAGALRSDTADNPLFAVHCTLFGMAAVLFELSTLWDATWWAWHLLRLTAYLVAAGFAVVTYMNKEWRLRQAYAELAQVNRHLEALVERRTRELARSNADLEQFAYVASHDLQEPLRKVSVFGEMLVAECGAALGPQGVDYVHRMRNAARRMQTLINDLLTLSRVSTQARPFELVELEHLAHSVVADLEIRLRETGGRIEIEALPPLRGDAAQLRQLLQNLLSNALKFHRPGVPPQVRVSARIVPPGQSAALPDAPPGPLCELTVEDNGIGFDMKYLDRVFAPFQRLHSREQYEGSGIGLAICQKIVERHGGRITATSQPEVGSRFVVVLPVDGPPTPSAP
jgi:signal transduction histidine kinase